MKSILVVISLLCGVQTACLPPFITVCNKNGINLNQCIKTNLEVAKSYFIDGAPQFHVPSFNPFVLAYAKTEIPNFSFALWNTNITGFENFDVLKVDADLQNNSFNVEIYFPLVEGVGFYEMEGKKLNLILNSTGNLIANAEGMHLYYTLKTELYHKNGQIYIRRVKHDVRIELDGNLYTYYGNLYLGQPELSEVMNRILNANSQYIFKLLIPVLEDKFHDILDKAIDNFFDLCSYNELFV